MSVTRPRGPLPARVYWTRRVLVLGVAFALVFGIGRLLGGDPGESAAPAAQPAAATAPVSQTPSARSTADSSPTREPRTPGKERRKRKKVHEPLAMPTGPCIDSDVRVRPTLRANAYAGSDVRLTLRLTTYDSPACTWEVSPETVAVKLTSGDDRIWTSQECPAAVPTEQVVLRDRKPVLVDVVWHGRRSDPDCSRSTLWAEPGYYHVAAAAMGSEPEDEQFRLLPPAPVTITPTPTPTPKADKPARGGDAKPDRGSGEQD